MVRRWWKCYLRQFETIVFLFSKSVIFHTKTLELQTRDTWNNVKEKMDTLTSARIKMAGTLYCDVFPFTCECGWGGGEFSGIEDLSEIVVVESSKSLDWSCCVTTCNDRRNHAEPSNDDAAIEFRLSRNFWTRSWNNYEACITYLIRNTLRNTLFRVETFAELIQRLYSI